MNEGSKGHFYFARHGQTVWNVDDRICGRTDSPLTDAGHEQAIKLGEEILRQGIRIDEILYSPLSRAKETALHVSEMIGVPAREELRLIEQNFGIWEGTSPRNAPAFQAAKGQFAAYYGTGESMLKLCQRIYNLIDDLKAEPDKVYLLVAHNGISRAVHSYFYEMTNEEFAGFGIKNCQIVRYDFEDER